MSTFKSLEDLKNLLSDDEQQALKRERADAPKLGYDGKPQKLDVQLDTKRRRGKTVTLITGFQSSPTELKEIAQQLKKACGAGGTVLDNVIEIQGDHRNTVVTFLEKNGFIIRMK